MRSQLVPIVIRPVGFGRVGPDDRLLEPRLIDRRLAQPHLVLPRAAAEDHAYTRRRLAVEALEEETDLPLGRLGIPGDMQAAHRSEKHTPELQSLMRTSYAVYCVKKKKPSKRERITSTNK